MRRGHGTQAMDDDTLLLARDGAVATLRLLRPVADAALDRTSAAALVRQLDELEADDALRVLVLRYDGDAETGAAAAGADDASATAGAVERLGRFTRPVVAAIDGGALGVALELALACDLRVGTHGASYGLPRIRVGAMPYAGATQRLPRLVGQGRAFDMVLSGDAVGTAEARRIGLLQRVVDPAQLDASVHLLATAMAQAAPASMRLTKEALHQGLEMTLDQGLRMELDLYLLLFSTADRVEGITAFRDKRRPRFSGA
jgi:enoyl-CoA hydratase/carnithine racemase